MGTEVGECRVFVVDTESEALAGAPLYRDLPDRAARLRALAGALTSSPGFKDMDDAVLVVRTDDPVRLALIGRFSPSQAARVEALPRILAKGLRRLRYVTYAEAELAARNLADQLSGALGADILSRCRFVGLPRGGLFVLGMLAYLLDLRADQVGGLAESASEGTSPDVPLILVDDCALSGLRFAETLERVSSPTVVFAHLFSHPRLREEIVRREPRVVRCLAGDDLVDMADDLLGADRDAWESRWRELSDPRVYWIGLPEHVCFPWNEPDVTIWNETSGAEEAPWRIVPPEYCLKNRAVDRTGIRLHEQGAWPGPMRVGADTVFARFDDEVIVADVGTGEAYSFSGIAGEMWTRLAAGASPDDLVRELAADYDADPSRLRADVDSLVDRAIGLGLMKRADGG